MSKYILFEHKTLNNLYLCEVDIDKQLSIVIIIRTIWQSNTRERLSVGMVVGLGAISIKESFNETPKEFLI